MLNELPMRQKNAHVPDGFVMRVGIPHSGGRLAAHAFNEGYAAMVSASAFWNRSKREFRMPEATDLSEIDFALDSAGYTGILNFQRKGQQEGIAGIFPWSFGAYLEFANLSGCSWFSQPDLCVEQQVAGDREAIDFRIRATATLLEGMLQMLYEWQRISPIKTITNRTFSYGELSVNIVMFNISYNISQEHLVQSFVV